MRIATNIINCFWNEGLLLSKIIASPEEDIIVVIGHFSEKHIISKSQTVSDAFMHEWLKSHCFDFAHVLVLYSRNI